jgi:hypothetical protein
MGEFTNLWGDYIHAVKYLFESAQTGIVAGTTRTRAGATNLMNEVNRIDTATAPGVGTTLGDGVCLMPSASGLTIIVNNNTANPVQVYGWGSDTINGVAGSTGIPIPPNAIMMFVCAQGYVGATGGAWFVDTGIGYSGALNTALAQDSVTAAGASQATATALTGQVNTVNNVPAGTGVNLPPSAPGQMVTVINTGANPLLVYPYKGASDTINGIAATQGVSLFPGTAAVFNCTATGAWTTQPASTKQGAYNTNGATSGTTLTAANISGAMGMVALNMTGALGAAANAQLPTVATLIAALHSPTVGTSFVLRVINSSSGAYAWTVTTNTGWTLNGTMSINQNTFRDFLVTLNSLTTATLQSIGTGTWS